MGPSLNEARPRPAWLIVVCRPLGCNECLCSMVQRLLYVWLPIDIDKEPPCYGVSLERQGQNRKANRPYIPLGRVAPLVSFGNGWYSPQVRKHRVNGE